MAEFSRDAPRTPPRFVPTLTEVVLPGASVAPPSASAPSPVPLPQQAPGAPPDVGPAAAPPAGNEQDRLLAVLQRVDMALQQCLGESVAAVLEEQTRIFQVRLRSEIESTVRRIVAVALADEMAASAARRDPA